MFTKYFLGPFLVDNLIFGKWVWSFQINVCSSTFGFSFEEKNSQKKLYWTTGPLPTPQAIFFLFSLTAIFNVYFFNYYIRAQFLRIIG